jgi:hypothetical protein
VGTTFDYETSVPVASDIQSIIRAEAETLKQSRDWWCETIWFGPHPQLKSRSPTGADGKDTLRGWCKVSYGGFSGYTAKDGTFVEVDYDDDQVMARRDAEFIISHLSAWSQRFALGWNLEYGDEEIGTITEGRADDAVQEFLERFFESKHRPANEKVAEELAKSISEKYASRK